MKLWCDAEVLRLTNMRAAQKARAGNPGPEGSIAKLAFATLNKSVYEWCIDTLGAAGIVDYDYTFRRPSEALLDGTPGSARKLFLRSRELDRGRHVGDHAQHPRRAHARPAGRAARRPRPAVVAGAEKLSAPLVVVFSGPPGPGSRRSPTRSVASCRRP